MTTKPSPSEPLVLTREQVRACDQAAIDRFAINSLILMENAGAAAARQLQSLLNANPSSIYVIAGPGNNGGDGFVMARHLANAAHSLKVLITCPREKYQGDALANLIVIEKMKLPIAYLQSQESSSIAEEMKEHAGHVDWFVDAMLGTGASGPPRQPIRTVIETLNQLDVPVFALDIPSGLDCDTGEVADIAVKANHTVTFAAMKKGFLNPAAQTYTGAVTTAGIGIDTHLLI
ncbi:MAG: NAD(P)H-hydrate epimerase [Sedimentisphaerales bacterium]|nr:NAD(P)H-hydrate epimerase [Sedimentisphaerales bacterium]